jgi:DNA polymerase
MEFADSAAALADAYTQRAWDTLRTVGVETKGQIPSYLSEVLGRQVHGVSAAALAAYVSEAPELADVCAAISKVYATGNSKYAAALDMAGDDGRIRGTYKAYGMHTGAWAGRSFNPLNLTRNTQLDVQQYKDLLAIYGPDPEAMDLYFYEQQLADMVRPTIVPKDGYKFWIADFSQIQNRIVSALAGEHWRTEAYAAGRDLYSEAAARMFAQTLEEVDDEARQLGKVAELACMFGGGKAAVLGMLPSMADPEQIVRAYRDANPGIVALWARYEQYWRAVVSNRQRIIDQHLVWDATPTYLIVQLPSGRKLHYLRPDANLSYEGKDGQGWARRRVYGGLIVQNIAHAIQRDYLVQLMLHLERAGHAVVLHTYDEVVCEVPEGIANIDVPAYDFAGVPLPIKSKFSNFYTH